MDDKLKRILEDYIKGVEEVCEKLLNYINESENLNLKNKEEFFMYRAKTKKMEFCVEQVRYKFHGIGCTVFSDGMFIDWDFGYRSRWCGIDPWKVSMTLKKNKSKYVEYYDGNWIKEICKNLVEQGVMFEKAGQYYFVIPESETFKPKFPKEYDVLIIEHYDSEWAIPRNKVIDRFIRKSTRVYNKIEQNKNKYFLRFFLNQEEIYSIFYDDVSYPESAIKIMTDEIIRNLEKV